ncbi:flagellar export chaperone FliS [Alkalicoccus chagannorensis]|uniref:flagellar export chaperone FliS n=1 Tax=Alkalicoccus chagannorensis TaxID=427072 RepID=UPI00042394BE|nr:flagellar export chaperone FliS [Alkalicoccus chagannorensis]
MISSQALHQKSPQEITALLYEALLDKLNTAKTAIADRDYIEANQSIQRSVDILQRLGAGINYESGGIIAEQLDALYSYAVDTLIQANYDKSAEKIEAVEEVLAPVAASWREALKEEAAPKKARQHQRVSAYEQQMMFEQ